MTRLPTLPLNVAEFKPRRPEHLRSPRLPGRSFLFILVALCLFAPPVAHSQDASAQLAATPPAKTPVDSELIVEGEGCFGHLHIFTATWWSKLYTGGVEYDRNSWGKFAGAQMDYVAELLPVTLLQEPAKTDVWGDPLTPAKQIVPGVGISPIGLRTMWRSNKSIKPYAEMKGGVIVFDKKVLSSDAAYANFLLQIGIGVQFRLTRRLDLRAGGGYMHFSNAFIVPSNPGLDIMSYNSGLSYHFGK